MFKRGLSDVVATVIIIALVIVAIAVVWLGVMPLIKDKMGSSDVCNSVDVSIESSQGYTCWAKDQNLTLVQIKKGSSDTDVSRIKFAISANGNSISYSNGTRLQKNSYTIFYLNTTGVSGIDKIEAVPFVKTGNNEKACSAVFVENLKSCGQTALGPTEVQQIISSGGVMNQDTTRVNGNYEEVVNPPAQTVFQCNNQNAQGFYNGTGTVSNPYGICNCTMLQNVKNYLSSNFVLLSNVDCSTTSVFVPIGSSFSSYFYGNFSGSVYNITSLRINLPSTTNVGLFGYVWGSNIFNVRLINASITGNSNVGGLVGYQRSGAINNSYFIGNVSGSSYSVGGLVGYQYFYCSINNSFSSGLVFSTSNYVGGLVGDQEMSNMLIFASYSSAKVTGNSNVGGLVGYTNSNTAVVINNSYSSGNVTGTSVDYWGANVGGLVGTNNGAEIYNSYSVGNVTGKPGYVGGFVGSNSGVVGSSNYWDMTTSGQSSDGGSAVGKLTADMKIPATFTNSGWSTSVWNLTAGYYPTLKWRNL